MTFNYNIIVSIDDGCNGSNIEYICSGESVLKLKFLLFCFVFC